MTIECLYAETITAEQIVDKMEEALAEGVEQKEEYLYERLY